MKCMIFLSWDINHIKQWIEIMKIKGFSMDQTANLPAIDEQLDEQEFDITHVLSG